MRSLGHIFRTVSLLAVLATLSLLPVHAEKWYQPTSQQLSMTSDPKAPNADAVYLYLEKKVDDTEHLHSTYAVIKILTAGGKKWADVKLPYDGSYASIDSIEGRTIEPDGTVVPFKGKPYKKLLYQGENDGTRVQVMEKVFTLPDVKVGSILEYRYILDYDNNTISSPQWLIQRPLFVHEGHYHFVPATDYQYYESTDALGHKNMASHLLYSPVLPKGVKVQSGLTGFDLVVKDVPALVKEKDEVPMNSISERLLFYYSPYFTGKEFWAAEGKEWSQDVDSFVRNSPVIQAAVSKIVSPSDTPEQKAIKIYEAVMKLNNTSFTRTHSSAENHAEGVKVKDAADIWRAQQGTDDEIDELFIAMARSAGLKAYAMRVCDRRNEIFNANFMSWNQLDDDIAIIVIDGKEVYLDPGQRYNDYGKLAWFHTLTGGIRQTDNGTILAETPGQGYRENTENRVGTLRLGPDGSISGQVRVVYSGSFSLALREDALAEGIVKMKAREQKRWNRLAAAGMQVKVDHFIGLTSTDMELMEVLDVSGTLGTRAGHLRIIPGNFLEAGAKPLFTSATRKMPIDLGASYMVQDSVTLTLPSNYTVQGVPKNGSLQYLPNTAYRSMYTVKGNTYNYERIAVVAAPEYPVADYQPLKSYFQSVSQEDQQPLVFKVGPVPVQAAVPTKASAGASASTGAK